MTKDNNRRSMESQWYLPYDLITHILIFLPADILYNIMRFICKDWYNIIQSPSFISSHLQNSSIGLLINNNRLPLRSYILKSIPNHGFGVELKELKFKRSYYIKASCNGLVFVIGPEYRNTQCPCYIANLVTKQHLPLPLIPDNITYGRWYLVYVAASRVYKIFYYGERQLLLTVGVDKGWRKVNISNLTTHQLSSISIGGYLYWVQSREEKVPILLRFDMETETFKTQLPLPPLFHHKYDRDGQVFALGSSLCLYKRVDDYSFDFWLLKDPQTEHGQWEKLPNINLTGRPIKWCYPDGWLQSGELLVLNSSEGVLVYNVKTEELHRHEELNKDPQIGHAHVESLVPMNNLSLMTTGRPSKMRISKSKLYSKDIMSDEFREGAISLYW